MESRTNQSNLHRHHQNHQPSSGLSRFRSAPSSLLATFTGPASGDFSLNKGNPCEESESQQNLMSRFATCSEQTDSGSPHFQEFEEKLSPPTSIEVPLKLVNSQQGFSPLPPHYVRPRNAMTSNMDSSYGLVSSMGMGQHTEAKSFSSQLIRQSSSPAGLFTNIPFQNGYNTMKGLGISTGAHRNMSAVSPSMNGLKNRTGFPSRTFSSLGMLSQISETDSENINGTTSPEGSENCETGVYGSELTYGAWNDSSIFSDNITGLKRQRSNDEKIFSSTHTGGPGNHVQLLSHHLSLPKASSEMVSVDKFLEFQDSVPCKIRAKRGCATHPRSIAERVRRTRISERMRKLQELVPKMDKQTNTADMLDLAVEYIKDLQKQFKTLRDNRAKCTCLNMQKQVTNQIV